MKIVGIDCGKAGGIAAVTAPSSGVAWPIPLVGSEYDADNFVAGIMGADHVYIEEPPEQVRTPGGGLFAKGIRSLWQCFGIVQGFCAGMRIPFQPVKSQAWRKAMLPHMPRVTYADRKQSSVLTAKRLFPNTSLLATPRCKVSHDGMGEALLIAEYGRRALGGARNF